MALETAKNMNLLPRKSFMQLVECHLKKRSPRKVRLFILVTYKSS